MKNNRQFIAAMLSVFGLLAGHASAEEAYSGAWYAVPGVSLMNTDKDLAAKNGGGASIRLGKELSPHWDIQSGLSYARANDELASGSGRYKQTSLGMDALYMLGRDNFRPFLLTGLGVANNKLDYSTTPAVQDKSKTSWLANIGLGAQYLFNDSFGVQADVRQQWTRSTVKSTGVFDSSGTVGNTLLNLGGVFRFPAPTAMPVAESVPAAAPVQAAAAPDVPVAAALPACKPSFETVTILAEKLFAFDQDKLQDGSKPTLDEVANKIKANADVELVLVTGHTDRLGSEAYNQKLSERRANQVKAYLMTQGVSAKRLQASGKGESEPVVACKGDKSNKKLIECLQPNRRVVISAEKQREMPCR
jgi:OOP family OmpA-OmpF porin